jgi:DNA-binding winged helix-turn-helix (wHTH) protein
MRFHTINGHMLLRIGTCQVDTERRRIVRDGRECHLSRKPFELLLALVESRPNVIPKQQLLDRVWPDAFVSEANLAVLIGEVRAAIGDSARRPHLIKTHHGVGYSFVGAAEEMPRVPVSAVGGAGVVLHAGERRILLTDGHFTVGRVDTCDIVFRHRSVSRLHARIRVLGNVLIVEDANSKNGTSIDGVAVTAPTAVHDGQTITFGSVCAVVVIGGPSSTTETIRER